MHKTLRHKFRLQFLGCLCVCLLCGCALAATTQTPPPSNAVSLLAEIGPNQQLTTHESRRQAIERLATEQQSQQEAGNKAAAARLLNRMAEIYLLDDNAVQAVKTHQQALSLAQAEGDQTALIDSLNGLGEAALRDPRENAVQKAKQAIEHALDASIKLGYERGIAQAHLILSSALYKVGDMQGSVREAQTALALWQKLEVTDGAAQAQYCLGEAYLELSEEAAAAEAYYQSLLLWQKLSYARKQASALIGSAYLEQRRGEWQKAQSYFDQAQLLITPENDPFQAAQIANGLGFMYEKFGVAEQAKQFYESGANLYQRAGHAPGIAADTLMLARIELLLGNPDAALQQLLEILPLERAQGIFFEALTYQSLGETQLIRGDSQAAVGYFQQALAAYGRIPSKYDMARVRTFLGQAYQVQGRDTAALQEYNQALAAFQSCKDRNSEAVLHYALGRLELKRGKLAAAGGYLQHSLELTEQLRDDAASKDLRTALLASTYQRYESYIDWLMQMHQRQPTKGYDSKALLTNEQAHARTLLETLQQAHATLETGFDPQLVAQKRNLEQQLRLQEAKQTDLLSRRLDATAITAELRQSNEQYEQVKQKMAAINPRFAALTQPRALSLEDIRQLVPDDNTAFFEYAVGEDRSYLWAVTKAGLVSYTLPGRERLETAAGKVRQILSQPPNGDPNRASDLRQATGELSRMVLPPAAPLKPRLVIVSDGVLGFIPFQILTTAERPDEPLLEQYEIVNTPSFTTLAELQSMAAQRQPAKKLIAAFGDPVFRPDNAPPQMPATTLPAPTLRGQTMAGAWRDVDDTVNPADLPPLAFSRQEVDDVTAINRAGESFKALRFDATLETLKNTDLSQFRVLHLSTHGLFNSKRPEHSGVVLSTFDRQGNPLDGFLGLGDVYNLRAPVDLVVLSACRTGLGKDVRGEGLMSLTRGFMYAGASSVAASLWKVDDAATANLMKDFYDMMLREGKPPAAALRAAQRAMRQQKTWHDPFYWAAFTLHGEYRKPLIAPTPPRSLLFQPLLWLLALIAISGGIIIFRRKRLQDAV